ncbi:EamA family transporter [Altererythrobacter xixiisoli]|uniref:EamA family transporter n=1 Tax=Croceibacterium xixiisoli TaxID=1476466 RepID=A0A6I4TRW1_9SPHN|nr:EamA family transporter [Croceibacterium xixiisoli]MXO98604.1 EamA family transporter [Croceibacterium xixiisoli]
MLWVPITIAGAVAQVLRNGAQASLTGRIGTLGATQVRFVFGLPFALLFLGLVLAVGGQPLPHFTMDVWGWAGLGALAQIFATALMLAVMRRRAFAVAYAYIKTEPVVVAVLGVILLGDHLSVLAWIAVVIVTAGVLISSIAPQDLRNLLKEGRMMAAGVVSGGLFGLSSIAFRGAIDGLEGGGFVLRSMTILVTSLTIQTLLLGIWLALRDRQAFIGSLREWRRSTGAGFLGALASAFWFMAFALTPAANVRTLALIEVPVAALLSRRVSGRRLSLREMAGLVIITLGVALLFLSAAL